MAMMLRVTLVVTMLGATAMLWAAAPPAPWTKQQKAKLAERDRLEKSLKGLLEAKKYDDLLAAARRIAELGREVLSKANPEVIGAYGRLATWQEALGQLADAVETRRELLRMHEKRLGKDHWETTNARIALEDAQRLDKMTVQQRAKLRQAEAWNAEVFRLWSAGKSKEALPLAEKALALRRKMLGEMHPHTAESWFNLGAQYASLQQFEKAEECYRKALEIHEVVLGKKHPAYAASLNNLAYLYQEMGEYARALPLYKEALQIREEVLGKKHPDCANSLNNLALLYKDMGEIASALPLLEQAVQVKEQVLGKKHHSYANSLNNLAMLYRDMGENARALHLLKEVLQGHEEALGKKHPDYATSLSNLALLYRDMGENARALPLLKEALQVREEVQGRKHPDYALNLNILAMLYQGMGENTRALPLYKESLQVREKAQGKKHPNYATSLNNLAALYQAMGENARALSLFKEALQVRAEAQGKKHPDYAESLNNLAALYQAMRENARALPLYKEALQVNAEALGKKHPHYASSLNNLALLYKGMGENARALPLYKEALQVREEVLGKKHPDYATSLNNLALLYQGMGKAKEAAEASALALEVLGHRLDDDFDLLGERQRNQALQNVLHNLGVLLSVQEQAGAPAAERYPAVLAWKGRVAIHSSLDRLALDVPKLKQPLDRLQAARARLARLALQTPAPARQAAWLRDVRELTEEKEALEADLARRSAEFRARLELRKLNADQLARELPEGRAFVDLIEYTHYSSPKGGKGKPEMEQRLLAFVTLRGKEVALVPLGAARPVSDAVARWRAEVQKDPRQADRKALREAATLLRQKVWDKLNRHTADARTVIVAPDGALTQFPLAALPGAKSGTFLIEDVAIAQVASGTQLFELLQPAARDAKVGKGLLAAGGIDYGPGRSYSPLPGTGPEARRCRELFSTAFAREPAALLEGKAATTTALRQEMARRPKYLHLATHGYFEPPEKVLRELKGLASAQRDRFAFQLQFDTLSNLPGLRCGLALAGANAAPPVDDADALPNVLTGHDLEAIDLRGCDVAVLSACQTALGDVQRSQGVLGLQRAFHAAGVRTTVTSLWSVQDAATVEMMEEFYKNLWGKKSMTRLDALRQAQLAILRDPERVRKRSKAILADAKKRGLDESALTRLKGRVLLPEGGKIEPDRTPKTSPEAWWAAFVLCGDWR
jgi:CHAT domain-containing protein/tetratricopeptide (TPR) repeat protein